jgi:hypothetical protein
MDGTITLGLKSTWNGASSPGRLNGMFSQEESIVVKDDSYRLLVDAACPFTT